MFGDNMTFSLSLREGDSFHQIDSFIIRSSLGTWMNHTIIVNSALKTYESCYHFNRTLKQPRVYPLITEMFCPTEPCRDMQWVSSFHFLVWYGSICYQNFQTDPLSFFFFFLKSPSLQTAHTSWDSELSDWNDGLLRTLPAHHVEEDDACAAYQWVYST